MNGIAILGASGHGKVVADLIETLGLGTPVFFDDAWPRVTRIGPWFVVGNGEALLASAKQFAGVVVAIGQNRVRLQKLHLLQEHGAELPILVHPVAAVSRHATLESGSIVLAGAVVGAFAKVGLGAILNTGCSVDHDCVLGDAVHVSPGARLAGGVQVGTCSWIGIGAAVRQMVRIGANVMVGAGAAVVTDTGDEVTVVGVPAQPMMRK